MININLLIKPPPRVRWQVVLLAGVAFTLLGVSTIVTISAWAGYQRLKVEVVEMTKLVAGYTEAAGRMTGLQAELERLQANQDGVAAIGRNQSFSQSAVLGQIRVTTAGVSLQSISSDGAYVTITGEAPSFAVAMEYLAHLRSASLVMGVREESVQVREDGGTSFTFIAQIRPEVEVKAKR